MTAYWVVCEFCGFVEMSLGYSIVDLYFVVIVTWGVIVLRRGVWLVDVIGLGFVVFFGFAYNLRWVVGNALVALLFGLFDGA